MHEVDQIPEGWDADAWRQFSKFAIPTEDTRVPIQAEERVRETSVATTSLYTALENVYRSAFGQAAFGKGKERHAGEGERFEDQFICQGQRDFGLGGGIFQAVKKCKEALGMVERGELDRARFELLGAMNYIAATVIVVEEKGREKNATSSSSRS